MKKLSFQQEAFAQAIFSGKNQSDAYRVAYPKAEKWTLKSVNEQASVLAKQPKVISRLEELRIPVIKEAQMSVESHLAKLKELRDAAAGLEEWPAAIKAEELRGKVAGFYVDRKEIKLTRFDDLSAEARANAIDQVRAAINRAKLTHDA